MTKLDPCPRCGAIKKSMLSIKNFYSNGICYRVKCSNCGFEFSAFEEIDTFEGGEDATIWCSVFGLLVTSNTCRTCEHNVRCQRAKKTSETQDKNNASNPNKVKHFGVWLNKKPSLKLSRENYAIINNHNSFLTKRTANHFANLSAKEREKYADADCKFYSNSWCERHRKNCLLNFDKNMDFFRMIDRDGFEASLSRLVKSNERTREIFDLSDCDGMTGIYILVLGEYKQMYIGQSVDIKKRILQHWNKVKEFDRLIFGGVNDSVLSVDSFGALDTTRIFVLETPRDALDYQESFATNIVPDIHKLNRVGGGQLTDLLSILATWNRRNLD